MKARPGEGTGLAALERLCAELFTLPDVLTLLFADNPIITDETFAEAAAESRADAEARTGADAEDDPLEAVIARGQADGSSDDGVPLGGAAAFG